MPFAPITLRLNGRSLATTTLPGTLVMPTGWDGSNGWSVFVTSSARLDSLLGSPPPMVHSRIIERNGDEVLVEIPRDTSGLVLSATITLADSTSSRSATGWRLRWSGFRPGTDLPNFIALVSGETPSPFALLRGDGVLLRNGEPAVMGQPPVAVTASNALFVGAERASLQAANTLIRLHARPDSAQPALAASVLASSDISLWAAQTLPPLLRALGDRSALNPILDTPYAFLKGWNHRYAPDAIAPSIFETWLESHRDYTGHLPDPSDSLDVLLFPYTLRIARATLRDTYGPEWIDWQWSRVQGGFTQPLVNEVNPRAVERRFEVPSAGTGGHPTALLPGPDRPPAARAGTGSGPATWSTWATLGASPLTVRSPRARIASSMPGTPAIFRLNEAPSAKRPSLTLAPPS